MQADFVKSITNTGLQSLQLFNQNTLSICHNMLRHLPRNKSAFSNVHKGFDTDRVSEIETFLLDQTEKLIEVSKSNRVNPKFGIDIPRVSLRSDTEKRFTALLNHFINYSKKHNPKVFDTLYVEYADGSIGQWDKAKLDKEGGVLKGHNPIKLHNFAKAVANSSDPDGELTFETPMLKEPSKELELKDEAKELVMGLIKEGTIDLDEGMTKDEFLALVAEINVYADALKYKENSLKLRQETLLSTFRGNPSGELRDMLMGTNALTMELKREQMILFDVVDALRDYALIHSHPEADATLDEVSQKIDTYNLMKDDKLTFIVRSEALDQIENNQPEQEFGLNMHNG